MVPALEPENQSPGAFHLLASRRHMVRAFDASRPLAPTEVDELLATACTAPSAGNTQGWHFVVLEGPEQTARFWSVSLPAHRRASFGWPGLLDAPVLICPVGDPSAYVRRYAEDDKASTGLGEDVSAWSFPYWLTDTAFATMQLLLAADDRSLGACFFGLFGREEAVRTGLNIPAGMCPIGMVALGHPAPDPTSHRPGRSAKRPPRPAAEIVHRGGW